MMTNPELLGLAIKDFHLDRFVEPFMIHYPDLEPDEMPVEVFFRELEEMPDIERYALSLVRGSVLDVGAGAGAHCLELQKKGFKASGLDISGDCCEVMKNRGVDEVIHQDLFHFAHRKFDTILLLMNGIGIAKNLSNLPDTFRFLKSLLNPGGQVLFDSSDLSYLDRKTGEYMGEMEMWYEYKGRQSTPGEWLYIDPYKLIEICENSSIKVEVIIEDDTGLYLARVT